MDKLIKNSTFSLPVVLFIGVFIRLYILHFLSLAPHLRLEEVFVSNLISKPLIIPSWLILIFGLGNILLLWLVGKRLFDKRSAFLTSLLYAISPWTAYLDSAGAHYVFILFFLLLAFLSLLNLRVSKGWSIVLVISTAILLYGSLLMWIVVPILLWGAIKAKFLPKNNLKILVISFLVALIPILLLMLVHMNALKSE